MVIPLQAQEVGTDKALLFHDRGTTSGEWLSARPDRTIPAGKYRHAFYKRLGGPQGGQDGRKISPHRDSIPDPPAHSQSI